MGKILLNIGCGDKKIQGFVNIDTVDGADLRLDVRHGLPFENNSVDGIFSEHFIEHLTQAEGAAFFRECRRVLKNHGRVRVATPDLDYLLQIYQTDEWKTTIPELTRYGYGWIANPAEHINVMMREWGHLWLYNEEELVRIASVAGLTPTERCRFGQSSDVSFCGLEYRKGSRLIYEFVKARPTAKGSIPLISILIPAYNPRYFRAALESALHQSYERTEIIVGDDSRSGEIEEIVRACDPLSMQVRYERNPKTLGAKANYCRCFDAARGDYIKYLNDDDLLHPCCVERMAQCLTEHPDVTLITSSRNFINASGEVLQVARLANSDSIINGVGLADMMLTNRNNYIGEPTTVMFRKQDLLGTVPDILSFANRSAHASGDVTMWVNLLSKGDLIYLSDPLSSFRVHEEQRQSKPDYKDMAPRAWDQIQFDARRMGFMRNSRKIAVSMKPLAQSKSYMDSTATHQTSLKPTEPKKAGIYSKQDNSVDRNRSHWSSYDWSMEGDEWSGAWGGSDNLWHGTIFPRIQRFLPAGHILEIAPGFGRCTQFLVDQTDRLSIVDLTARCIDACKKRFHERNTITFHVNDGRSLEMIEDESVDFAFSWDSLVHAEPDVLESYVHQLKRKLKPGGAGFIHHSNIGEYLDIETGNLTVENKHWRATGMTAELFRTYCREAGLVCVSQEIVPWGGSIFNDCFSIVLRDDQTLARDCTVIRNQQFMNESREVREDYVKRTNPQDVHARAHQLMKSQRPGQGLLLMEDLVRLHPSFAPGQNDFGLLLLNKGELQQALERFKLAVKLEPRRPDFIKNLADFYLTVNKQSDNALAQYAILAEIRPVDPEPRLTMAKILVSLDRFEEARQQAETVLSFDPDNASARQILDTTRNRPAVAASWTQQGIQPLISIIIPTRNRAELLRCSLESLVHQDLPANQFEVIVVNDGSKDHTEEVCRFFEENLVIRHVGTESSGIAAAKNYGVLKAQAGICLFFDDDDVATPQMVREHLKTHHQHPQENVAVLGYTSWAPTLAQTPLMQYVTDVGQFLFSYVGLSDGQVLDYTYFWGGRSSCKRALLLNRGMFDPQFQFGCEDIELGYRLSKAGFTVLFNRNAASYMNRALTYDEFCRRCEKQGKSQYQFSRKHPDPVIQKYCLVNGAEEKWQHAKESLISKTDRVGEIESLIAAGSSGYAVGDLLPELNNLYAWTFMACKFKGIVEEKRVVEQHDKSKPEPKSPLSRAVQKGLDDIDNRWPAVMPISRAKENILIIDPYLPMFDRASGSLRLWHLLRAFRAMQYHVTFIARDAIMSEQYVPLLQDLGIEVYAGDQAALEAAHSNQIGSYFDLRRILSEKRYGYVILDFWHLAKYYLPLIRDYSPSSKIIIDTVDIHFLREFREAELAQSAELQRRAEHNKHCELEIYEKADRLWVVTPEDKKAIEKMFPLIPIDVVPNIHDRVNAVKQYEQTADLLFVGNFNHTPNRDAVHYLCKEIWPLIAKELNGTKLYVVGNNPPSDIQRLASDRVIVTRYVRDLSPYLTKARISVNPLRYGAGMKGKIGEALAWGLPVVTTSIGAEGMGLLDSQHVLIADAPEQFAEQTVRLYRDRALWNRLSENGRMLVQRQWSPDAVRVRLESILSSSIVAKDLVSIVILTFNQLKYTKKCVKSIRKHTPEAHEIIFVDNGSTDGTVKWLRKLARENTNYKLVENSTNLGFAKGCNQGIQAASGEYLVLLNNDVIVTENWLSGMLECLRSAPETGIVGPMTNKISGPQQVVDDTYRSLDYLETYARKFRETYRHRRIPLRRIVGFCLLFTRELVDRIGPLDESFGTGNFEDDDFCLRAALEGYRNFIAGDVFIHHFGSVSFVGNQIDYCSTMTGNRKIIERKWTLRAQNPLGKKLAVVTATEAAAELCQKGLGDKAAEMLIDCIKTAPDASKIYFELARMLIESKRCAEAWEVVESMPEPARDALKGLELAGYSKEGLGCDDEADAHADGMLALDPNYAPAINLKGVLAYKRGDKEAAEDYFKKAMASDPGYGEAYTNLGVLRWAAEDRTEALGHLSKGFILSPTVSDHSTLYYSAVAASGTYSDAEALFRDAKGLFPQNRTIAFLYIDTLIQRGKFGLAMTEIEDAIVDFGLDDGTLDAALSVRDQIGPRLPDKKGSKKATLSLCMIVKNEEEHLAKCLKSVRPLVDEIIVVDTGSTDRTKEIAQAFGARLFEIPWSGDFAVARNHSLSKASGDWILILDADEVLSPLDFKELTELIGTRPKSPVAYSIVTRNYLNDARAMGWTPNEGQYPEEAGRGWMPSHKVRLFARDRRIAFADPVHETLEASLKSAGIPIRPCGIVVHHYGRLIREREVAKGEDYYRLGKEKLEREPNNLTAIRELATQAQNLERYEEATELWQKAISLTREHPVGLFYFNLGSCYLRLEQYERALEASKEAMRLDPGIKEAALNCATCHTIAGSLDDALALCHDLLERFPDYPMAVLASGMIFCIQGNSQKAQELFKRLAGQGVNFTDSINSMAKKLLSRQRQVEALALLNAAIQNGINNHETIELMELIKKKCKAGICA